MSVESPKGSSKVEDVAGGGEEDPGELRRGKGFWVYEGGGRKELKAADEAEEASEEEEDGWEVQLLLLLLDGEVQGEQEKGRCREEADEERGSAVREQFSRDGKGRWRVYQTGRSVGGSSFSLEGKKLASLRRSRRADKTYKAQSDSLNLPESSARTKLDLHPRSARPSPPTGRTLRSGRGREELDWTRSSRSASCWSKGLSADGMYSRASGDGEG